MVVETWLFQWFMDRVSFCVLTQLLTLENIGKRIDQRKVWHIIPSSASHPLHSYCFVGSVVLDISYANAEKTRWQLELLCFLFLPHHLHNNAKSDVCMADFQKRFSFADFPSSFYWHYAGKLIIWHLKSPCIFPRVEIAGKSPGLLKYLYQIHSTLWGYCAGWKDLKCLVKK